jgi:hypothetical protein
VNLTVVYHVTDCANALSSAIHVHIRIDHPWGTETETLRDAALDFTDTAHDACRAPAETSHAVHLPDSSTNG